MTTDLVVILKKSSLIGLILHGNSNLSVQNNSAHYRQKTVRKSISVQGVLDAFPALMVTA